MFAIKQVNLGLVRAVGVAFVGKYELRVFYWCSVQCTSMATAVRALCGLCVTLFGGYFLSTRMSQANRASQAGLKHADMPIACVLLAGIELDVWIGGTCCLEAWPIRLDLRKSSCCFLGAQYDMAVGQNKWYHFGW